MKSYVSMAEWYPYYVISPNGNEHDECFNLEPDFVVEYIEARDMFFSMQKKLERLYLDRLDELGLKNSIAD